VSWYQKGKTNLDFTAARDNEWQWHQLGCTQVCTSLKTDNHTSTAQLDFLQANMEMKTIDIQKRQKFSTKRYGVSCTAQLPSPAEPREETPHCRPYFNLQNYFLA